MKKPTVDPSCPPEVIRAKRAYRFVYPCDCFIWLHPSDLEPSNRVLISSYFPNLIRLIIKGYRDKNGRVRVGF
jgi:hypothetical protein